MSQHDIEKIVDMLVKRKRTMTQKIKDWLNKHPLAALVAGLSLMVFAVWLYSTDSAQEALEWLASFLKSAD